MQIKKSELKEIIREVLLEEGVKKSPEVSKKARGAVGWAKHARKGSGAKRQFQKGVRQAGKKQSKDATEANWIKGAIKKPGALRKSVGVKKGEKIPAAAINKKIATLHKKGEGDKKLTKPERTELRRLNLAKTLRKMK